MVSGKKMKERLFRQREGRQIDFQVFGSGAHMPYTYGQLNGERRRAYVRQWYLATGLAVFYIIAALGLAFAVTSGVITMEARTAYYILGGSAFVLLAGRYIYAFHKHETYIQLTRREFEASNTSDANKQELLEFAEQTKKDTNHG